MFKIKKTVKFGLASQEKGIYVVLKNVVANGSISIEFTKAIGKSTYEKLAFNEFTEIKSYVSAELKYQNYEERYAMSEISTTKKMQHSKTSAEILLTNHNLSTIAKNDNVEARIVLNNDKQDTDLYQNPSFELVFPKNVTNVTVENIGMIYGNGLKIADFEIYQQDNQIRMRIETTGIQTVFSENVITNGTNIILNLNITLDEYTPKKQDQIKLYYCNEAVSHYEAETNWNIKKAIPNGILKQTNGFDAEIIHYQAPSGFMTANSIINYDGKASKIKSIAQGEKTAEIQINGKEQIATMELVAMNNTGNQCTDAIFIGRIPFKGNKSVISQQELGTTSNSKLLNGIQEASQNPNMATIYYSTNENPSKDLKNIKNGWTTSVTDWQAIKTYMIIVKGGIEPGVVLTYTYDFEIPADLTYDTKMFGSFGGYYNNQSEKMVLYESSEADKVGLVTETKQTPNDINQKDGLNMLVYPYGENENLYYGQITTLITKVVNNTSEDIINQILKVSIPTGTMYTEKNNDGNYENNAMLEVKEFPIENLKAGEAREFEFQVRIIENDQDKTKLEGYADFNQTIQNYQFTAQKGEMSVNASLANGSDVCYEGSTITYGIDIHKNTDRKLEDLQMQFTLPDFMQINEIKLYDDKGEEPKIAYKDIKYSTENGVTTAFIGTIQNSKKMEINCQVKDLNIDKSKVDTAFNVYELAKRDKKYMSNVVCLQTKKADVDVIQSISGDEFNYHDEFEYRITIQNKSDLEGYISIKNDLPDNLYLRKMNLIVNGVSEEMESYNKFSKYENLPANGTLEIIATGEIMDWGNLNQDLDLSNAVQVILPTGEELSSNKISVKVHKNQEEKLEDEFEEENQEEENETLKQITDEESGDYSISGNIYVDADANGFKTEEEKGIDSQVQVQLMKGSNMVKATTTDSAGKYTFSGVESGDYSIVYNYNKEDYTSTNSLAKETQEVSQVIEAQEGVAVTDNITVTNSSIENVNIGLQEKDKFDFQIKQYMEQAIVNIKGEETEYHFDNLELAKLEIDPSDLKDASVKLKYKIVVTNVGNIAGQVSSIVDYLPNGVIFNQAENEEWAIGMIAGNVYYDGLKGIILEPGESQEISLVLNKKMTEDNTGVISNKVQIAYSESKTRLTEKIEGNFATQETIVTVTQGSKGTFITIVTTIGFSGMIGLFGYMIKTGKYENKFTGRKLVKKVYR